ncbi:unnamed protein product [Caenorhabditis auriculariae]|uniref:Uncharacterized protein n=1 Tax=Caenorhabditis auriculariae TaxID=2777116 RepID=A0A8S1H1A1_9PELO|nr:unnamed protein product [Caenorhabditis auriculariae]
MGLCGANTHAVVTAGNVIYAVGGFNGNQFLNTIELMESGMFYEYSFDDIYAGILAKKADILATHNPAFVFWTRETTIQEWRSGDLIAAHGYDAKKLIKTYNYHRGLGAEETVELPPKDESQDLVDGLNTMSIQSDRAETRMKTSSSWNLKAAPFTPSSEKNTKDKSKEESPADENNAEFSSVSYWAPSDMAYRRRLWSPPPKKVSDDKKASKGKKPSVAYERLRVSVVFQGKVLGPVNFTLNCIQKISGCKIRLNAAYLRPRTAFNFSLDRNPGELFLYCNLESIHHAKSLIVEFIEFECYKHGISYFIYPSGEIAPDFKTWLNFPSMILTQKSSTRKMSRTSTVIPDFAANSDQNVVNNTNFNGYPDFAANSDQNVVNNTNFNGYPDFAANSDQNVVHISNFNGYPDFAANSDQNVVHISNFNGYPDFAANSDQNVVNNTNFNGYPDFAANSDQNVISNFNGYPDFAANSDQNVVNNTNFNGYLDFAANSDQNVVNNTNFNGYPDFAANSDQNVVQISNFNGYPDFAANSDQNVVHNSNFNGYPDFAANSDQNVVNNTDVNGYPVYAVQNNVYDMNYNPVTPQNNHPDVNVYNALVPSPTNVVSPMIHSFGPVPTVGNPEVVYSSGSLPVNVYFPATSPSFLPASSSPSLALCPVHSPELTFHRNHCPNAHHTCVHHCCAHSCCHCRHRHCCNHRACCHHC